MELKRLAGTLTAGAWMGCFLIASLVTIDEGGKNFLEFMLMLTAVALFIGAVGGSVCVIGMVFDEAEKRDKEKENKDGTN